MVEHKISKEEFLKINEDDVMFITNPGRMGDEDGSTFIIRQDNEYKIYRLDGWMYRKEGQKVDISYDDALNQFPKWLDTLKHLKDELYNGKYKHLYMGFGNGLSIDNSIYEEFEPYLNEKVQEYLKGKEDQDSLKYAAIFNTWQEAFMNMVKDKEYILKK